MAERGEFHVRAVVTESNGEISASVEETNRVRALLGLKPLRVATSGAEKSAEEVAVENFRRAKEEEEKKRQQEEARRRVEEARERRARNEQLKGPTLGEAESNVSSVAAWVQRSRQKAKEQEKRKKAALSRAQAGPAAAYGSKDLSGLEVSHDVDEFEEGKQVILTLKDTDVLQRDEHGVLAGLNEDADELENVKLAEAKRNEERKRRQKRLGQSVYSGWDDDEFEADALALGPKAKKKLLRQYDEEEEAKERLKARTVIEKDGNVQAKARSTQDAGQGDGLPVSLRTEPLAIQSEYYTQQEMDAFKKPKRSKKKEKKEKKEKKVKRKKRKREEDEEDEQDSASKVAKPEPAPPASSEAAEEGDDDIELKLSLERAQRAAAPPVEVKVQPDMQVETRLKPEQPEDAFEIDAEGRRADGTMVFSSTTEFSSRLQHLVRSSDADRAEHAKEEVEEAMDVEEEPAEAVTEESAKEDPQPNPETFDSRQPVVGSSMSAALGILRSGGSLQENYESLSGRAKDRRSGEDDYRKVNDMEKVKKGPRRKGEIGEVVLEYRDEHGRLLTRKEAFRQLSYKFHGHGPGKKKLNKRLAQLEKEQREKSERKTATMKALEATTAATGKAYVVVEGGKRAGGL
mmetsp:Transcript_8388/g.31581  ORF Transcript_8388/g.31581 Transcript_8388/m.31581 type:complete len:631 (-) Transcript_8388:49-1941(-)